MPKMTGLFFFLALTTALTTAPKSFAASMFGRLWIKSLNDLPGLCGVAASAISTLLFLFEREHVLIFFSETGLYFFMV